MLPLRTARVAKCDTRRVAETEMLQEMLDVQTGGQDGDLERFSLCFMKKVGK